MINKAAENIYNELKEICGNELNGCGVGLASDKKSEAIHILLKTKKHLKKIPKEYQGYEVQVLVVGKIIPA